MNRKITLLHPSFGDILRGSLQVFRQKQYLALAFGSTVVILGTYLALPVFLVPGNSFVFEFSLFSPVDLVLLTTLAVMTGMLFSFELFSFRRSRALRVRGAGRAGASLAASLGEGVLAAASCGCGIGILLGVIGLGGGALFVAAHQTEIIGVFFVVVVLGLYFSARRAAGVCRTCQV